MVPTYSCVKGSSEWERTSPGHTELQQKPQCVLGKARNPPTPPTPSMGTQMSQKRLQEEELLNPGGWSPALGAYAF